METEEIVDKLMETVDTNKELINGLQKAFSDALDRVLKGSAEVIVLIRDEKQAYEVLVGISERLITNEEIAKKMKLPFWAKPFTGLLIKKFRPTINSFIVKMLDKYVLDRFGGYNWFPTFRQQAFNLVKGI